MSHELIPTASMPTIPMAFSSVRKEGWIFASKEFAVVIDHEPLALHQMIQMRAEGTKRAPSSPMGYTAAANIFYRKSRNPHGPSSRPVFIVALEHSSFSTEYERVGFIGKLFGAQPKPKSVFVGVFSASGHSNFGARPNGFTRASAQQFLLELAAEQVSLSRKDFTSCGSSADPRNRAALD